MGVFMNESKRTVSNSQLYYRHSLPVRIAHWLIVISLPVLLMSGLNIFNAHQALYWGKSSYSGAPPLLVMQSKESVEGELVGVTNIFGHEFITTGFLGASKNQEGELEARGFPSWLTLPGNQWLSMARRWHLFFAWMFVVTVIGFAVHAIVSRHLRQDLLPTREDWSSIGKTFMDHLRL